jgi:hypothetical protein
MMFDSEEAVLLVFRFKRSLYGFDRKGSYQCRDVIYQQRHVDSESAKQNYKVN